MQISARAEARQKDSNLLRKTRQTEQRIIIVVLEVSAVATQVSSRVWTRLLTAEYDEAQKDLELATLNSETPSQFKLIHNSYITL